MGSNKIIDMELQGAGSKLGLEIWCVEDLRLVSVPQSSHVKFFSGSAYVVLHTTLLKTGSLQHDIHYWLGNEANEVDSTLASDKALELDAALGSQSVQYKEVQGQETGNFLSYFKPCIIPVEGVYYSGQVQSKASTYETRLLTCKGDRVVHVKEVPFSRSSLNHRDVFILDTASKIFHFSGCNSSIQERAKALEVVQYINEYNKHKGDSEVAAIVAPKLYEEGRGKVAAMFKQTGYDVAELPDEDDKSHIDCNGTLKVWRVNSGKLSPVPVVEQRKLYSGDCYTMQYIYSANGREERLFYIWLGDKSSTEDRADAVSLTSGVVDSTKGEPVLVSYLLITAYLNSICTKHLLIC